MIDTTNHEGIPLFAAIKTFYENGSDILSAVCSLVLVTITDHEDINKIQLSFSNKYHLTMPNTVLQTILKRLKRNKLIDYGSRFSNVTKSDAGRIESGKLLSSVDSLNREFMALIGSLDYFFETKKYPKLNNTDKQLLEFIDNNLGFASRVLTSCSESISENMSRIAEYILHIEKSDPTSYVLLQNIFFGRLYLSMIRTRTEYSSNVNMEPIDLYLDTSIIMSLLGLHGKPDKDSSMELIELLTNASKVRICVFVNTIDEARRLLTSYHSEAINYTRNISVSSIHYELKLQGYDRHRTSLLIESLDKKINEMGIVILDLPANDRVDCYEEIKSNLHTWSELLEVPKARKTLEHDAEVLYGISMLRRNVRSKLLEKSRAVFISPDKVIHHFSNEISKANENFPLSLRPLDIASMLWMREVGSAQMATTVLRQSMMAYVREKAISNKLWDTFVSAVKEARCNDVLSRDDVALILASDDVSILLAEKQFEAPKQIIDPRYVDDLRNGYAELALKAASGDRLSKNINKKVHRISHGIALMTVCIVGALVSTLTLGLMYFISIKVGIASFLSFYPVFFMGLAIFVLLTFGKELKPAKFISAKRLKVYNAAYGNLSGMLKRYFEPSEDISTEMQ